MDNCLDCGNNDYNYDERLGEFACNLCGLVAVSDIVEETSTGFTKNGEVIRSADKGHLGSFIGKERGKGFAKLRNTHTRSVNSQERALKIGITHCNMALSELTDGHFTDELKETVASYYRRVISAHLLRGDSYEVRASAIVYYAMKEFGFSITLNECAVKTSVMVKPLFKAVRKIATFMRKPHLLSTRNAQTDMEKYAKRISEEREFIKDCSTIGAYLERLYDSMNKPITTTFFAVVLYITAELRKERITQNTIAKSMDITTVTIRSNLNQILKELGMPNRHLLAMLTVEDFVSGVRYD